jgi:hypothetical protein
MTVEVEALGTPSAAVDDVIRLIGELDAVQACVGQVLEEQIEMAKAFERRC